jgi:hypothetical protein
MDRLIISRFKNSSTHTDKAFESSCYLFLIQTLNNHLKTDTMLHYLRHSKTQQLVVDLFYSVFKQITACLTFSSNDDVASFANCSYMHEAEADC